MEVKKPAMFAEIPDGIVGRDAGHVFLLGGDFFPIFHIGIFSGGSK